MNGNIGTLCPSKAPVVTNLPKKKKELLTPTYIPQVALYKYFVSQQNP